MQLFLDQIDLLKERDWLGLVISYMSCGLNMSSNGPILQPKIQSFIHLGLSWPKSLILGTDQTFFLVLKTFIGIFFLYKTCISRIFFKGGASRWRVGYQWGLPGLVSLIFNGYLNFSFKQLEWTKQPTLSWRWLCIVDLFYTCRIPVVY